MDKNQYDGKALNVNGEEYNIFIEYDENENKWFGETYINDLKIKHQSDISKEELLKKIKNSIPLFLDIDSIMKEEELGDFINDKNIDDALNLIKQIDPLSPTSNLWEDDSRYPSFMSFAIQKNLPFLVEEMFKQIDVEKRSDLIDREFFILTLFNSDDTMWEIFLNNINIIHVTKKFSTFENALDVLLSKGYYNRLEQILPKLNNKEKNIVKKAINNEYDEEEAFNNLVKGKDQFFQSDSFKSILKDIINGEDEE